MRLNNSKKQLAKIIHANGGWRDGAEFSAQDGDGSVGGYGVKPEWDSRSQYWWRDALGDWFHVGKIKNHHQTILSRDEYFHLYPVAEAAPEPVVEAKPTIEQLAADYRNLLDFAQRKQQEADDAKADAEAKLAELIAAGKALRLVLSVAGGVPELVITDWRDLRVGDEVALTSPNGGGVNVGEVGAIRRIDDRTMSVSFPSQAGHLISRAVKNWKFIRRP